MAIFVLGPGYWVKSAKQEWASRGWLLSLLLSSARKRTLNAKITPLPRHSFSILDILHYQQHYYSYSY